MMTIRNAFNSGVALLAILSVSAVPMTAQAQSHRQKTKNEWRNIGIGSAAVGALGLLKGNSTLSLLGLGGALYSASRYEHDRKSQKADERRRAEVYGRTSYTDHGHKYVRKTVWQKGHKYYKFVKA